MIGIRARAVLPALLKDAPGRVVHHLLRRAAGARHLTDGLLREDRRNVSGSTRRAHVTKHRPQSRAVPANLASRGRLIASQASCRLGPTRHRCE